MLRKHFPDDASEQRFRRVAEQLSSLTIDVCESPAPVYGDESVADRVQHGRGTRLRRGGVCSRAPLGLQQARALECLCCLRGEGTNEIALFGREGALLVEAQSPTAEHLIVEHERYRDAGLVTGRRGTSESLAALGGRGVRDDRSRADSQWYGRVSVDGPFPLGDTFPRVADSANDRHVAARE